MKKLIAQRYTIRRNFTALICVCLSLYFLGNALFGERSSFRLMLLNNEISQTTEDVSKLHADRVALENKVTRLRPGSLDPDLLEERARVMLGFNYGTEQVLLNR